MKNGTKDEVKLEAFRQNWEQMRHAENARLGFLSFYAALVTAVLAFVASRGPSVPGDYTALYMILTVLAAVGFTLSLRIKKAIEEHRDKAEYFVKELTNENDNTKLKKYVPFPEKARWYNFWHLRILFLYLYGATFMLFLLVTLKVFTILH
ncbi:MAG: hypothetical protein HY670_01220 [Chloroflexi bacterium]|nr:hypothetical protein [Chloroflexota bacterium]